MSISASRPDTPAPLLSVIVPCHDVARWLGRCLDETLASLPDGGEAIFVDDGSTDATPQMLFEYALADRRIRVIRQEQSGVSAARNRGLDAARGKYIFFIDPDDGVEPDFFMSMVAAMEEENADYCICAFRERKDLSKEFRDIRLKDAYNYKSNPDIVEKYLPRIFGYSFEDVKRWYAGEPLFARREWATVWRAVFRRDIIERYRIRFDEEITLNEDAMFNAEYLVRANAMTSLDLPLYRVTVRDGSLMGSVPKDKPLYAGNKLCLLRRRKAIDAISGGRLSRIYAASNVLSAMELLRLGRFREFREYLRDEAVRASLKDFPVSIRKPLVALAYGVARLCMIFL